MSAIQGHFHIPELLLCLLSVRIVKYSLDYGWFFFLHSAFCLFCDTFLQSFSSNKYNCYSKMEYHSLTSKLFKFQEEKLFKNVSFSHCLKFTQAFLC